MPRRPVSADEQTPERMNELARAAQYGDEEAWMELVRVMRPPIVAKLRKLAASYSSFDMEDLEQAAQLGIAEALDRFNAELPHANFGAFAWNRVRSEISRWLAANTGAMPMPYESWRLGRKIDEALEPSGERAEDLGHQELVERTGINLAPEIVRARQNAFEPSELEHLIEAEDRDEATLEFVVELATVPVESKLRAALEFCRLWDLDAASAVRMVEASNHLEAYATGD